MAFSNVLTIFVAIILNALAFAVLRLIATVLINVQTVIVKIITFYLVLNYFDGYMILLLLIIYFGKIL